MVACCQPNPVQVVDNCMLWCEIPKSYFDNGASHQDVEAKMSSCLRLQGGNNTWPKMNRIMDGQGRGCPGAGVVWAGISDVKGAASRFRGKMSVTPV